MFYQYSTPAEIQRFGKREMNRIKPLLQFFKTATF
jgi:hypothetical protein